MNFLLRENGTDRIFDKDLPELLVMTAPLDDELCDCFAVEFTVELAVALESIMAELLARLRKRPSRA
jgi:hypothetical protein